MRTMYFVANNVKNVSNVVKNIACACLTKCLHRLNNVTPFEKYIVTSELIPRTHVPKISVHISGTNWPKLYTFNAKSGEGVHFVCLGDVVQAQNTSGICHVTEQQQTVIDQWTSTCGDWRSVSQKCLTFRLLFACSCCCRSDFM